MKKKMEFLIGRKCYKKNIAKRTMSLTKFGPTRWAFIEGKTMIFQVMQVFRTHNRSKYLIIYLDPVFHSSSVLSRCSIYTMGPKSNGMV